MVPMRCERRKRKQCSVDHREGTRKGVGDLTPPEKTQRQLPPPGLLHPPWRRCPARRARARQDARSGHPHGGAAE